MGVLERDLDDGVDPGSDDEPGSRVEARPAFLARLLPVKHLECLHILTVNVSPPSVDSLPISGDRGGQHPEQSHRATPERSPHAETQRNAERKKN